MGSNEQLQPTPELTGRVPQVAPAGRLSCGVWRRESLAESVGTYLVMKTSGIKRLVTEVLDALPKPYAEDVIDDVFFAIESHPKWRQRYDDACTDLGKTVVNNSIGYWIANALGKRGERQVSSRKSTLIASYSILDADAKLRISKPKEPDALKQMSDYYRANRSSLPTDIKRHRAIILDLIKEGVSPQEAFAMVLKNGK